MNIGDYTFLLQFIVRSLWSDDGEIIIGSPWMETLGTFIFNMKKDFFDILLYKKEDYVTRC
jgi:hypothetical protein